MSFHHAAFMSAVSSFPSAKPPQTKELKKYKHKKMSFLLLHSRLFFLCLQDSATMQFCANKLDKKDFFGKSDPFMVFYRSNEDGT